MPPISRRVFLAGAGSSPFGLLGLACRRPATTAPPEERPRTYHGVTFQHLAKGTDQQSMQFYEYVVDRLFVPAHPGARVEIIPDGGVGYWAKLLSLLAAGTPPDAAQQDEYFIAHLVAQDQLLDLGPYQAKDRRFNPGEMYEGAWRAGHYRGKLYGISVHVFGPVIVYNKDAFDEVGLPYPPAGYKDQRWTWNRMREDARLLTKRDAGGEIVRAGFAWDARFLSRLSGHFYAFGTKVVDQLDDPARCVLNEPGPLELIQLLHDMRHVDRTVGPPEWYGAGGALAGTPGDNFRLFQQGKIAMAVDLDRWGFFRSNEFRWDYAPLPRANVDGKAGGFVGTNVLTVMKGTRHPELAWDWVTTMGGLKAQEARLRELNIPIIPSWKPLRAEYARLTPPDSIYVNIDIGEYGTQSIMSTAYVDMQTEILAGLTPVWNGQVAIRDAVAEVVRKVNELLRQAPQ